MTCFNSWSTFVYFSAWRASTWVATINLGSFGLKHLSQCVGKVKKLDLRYRCNIRGDDMKELSIKISQLEEPVSCYKTQETVTLEIVKHERNIIQAMWRFALCYSRLVSSSVDDTLFPFPSHSLWIVESDVQRGSNKLESVPWRRKERRCLFFLLSAKDWIVKLISNEYTTMVCIKPCYTKPCDGHSIMICLVTFCKSVSLSMRTFSLLITQSSAG